MTDVRMTHIGGPTALIEIAGWRLLTDPTFDAPGRRYAFGWGTSSRKLAGPAILAADLGPIDAVLLTHDHHDDNLDDAGRALLPSAGAVVTTVSGAERLGGNARGLAPWQTTTLEAQGRPTIEITATPCRHGPPLSHPLTGDVIGFALAWEGQAHGQLWISGDTVLYKGVRDVPNASRRDGGAAPRRGAVPGHGAAPVHDDGRGAVELSGLLGARTVIPIHYEGWAHFKEGRSAIERAFAEAPDEIRGSVRWIPIGGELVVSA